MKKNNKILICGTLPPPNYGPSTIYKILMESEFVNVYDAIFFEMKFFTYKQLNKASIAKFLKLIKYIFTFLIIVIIKRPYYILYPISFDKNPFLKDLIFIYLGRILGCRIIQFDLGQYLVDLYNSSNIIYKKLLLRMLKKIDAFIVQGENTKKLYGKWYPLERIFIVPGSVNDTVEDLKDIWKNKNETINVLYFSVLSASKGLWTTLNSVPGVIKKNAQVRFIFAGPVDSLSTLEKCQKYVIENKLEDYIRFTGYIGDETKRLEYFRGSDIFIFPTQREAFGLVLLHAMAETLPVIATIEGNIPEIIEDGINGYLIAKGDSVQLTEKIIKLAGDPDLRKMIGETNRSKYLSTYTPANYGKNMITAFKSIKSLEARKD